VGLLARRALGGYTGDVLGATQQAAEIAVLAVAASLTATL
jgi:adenosylcobinamide-GDP ribazoletransferase